MQLRFIDEHNDRGHLLWAEEPVGLALRGETQQAALSKLPAELTAYRRWLGLPRCRRWELSRRRRPALSTSTMPTATFCCPPSTAP